MADVTRRDVFRGAGALGAAAAAGGLLAACGKEDLGEITVKAADVPVGSGVIQGNFVVVQPQKGEFKAFSAVCPHQGCLVNEIDEKEIVCPCHSSYFSSKDGSFISGAAQKPLAEAKITREGDALHVTGA